MTDIAITRTSGAFAALIALLLLRMKFQLLLEFGKFFHFLFHTFHFFFILIPSFVLAREVATFKLNHLQMVTTLVDGVHLVDLFRSTVGLAKLTPPGFALGSHLILFLPFMGLFIIVLICTGRQLLRVLLGWNATSGSMLK